MNPGVAYALAAFTIWGLYPLYFRLLDGASAMEVVLHRSVWALAFVLGVLAVLRRWQWLAPQHRQRRSTASTPSTKASGAGSGWRRCCASRGGWPSTPPARC